MLATPTRSVAANRTGRHPRRPQRALVPPLCGGTSGPGAPRRALHASGPERWPARQQAAQSAFPTRATGGRRHKRGGGDATLLLSATPTHAFAGTQHGFIAYAGNMVRVDDIDFRYPDPVLETFAYNDANELTSQVVNGVTTTFTYDDWGRMVTKTQGSYTAAYRYRYGDKLKRIDTNFPGESALPVDFLYDGLGRRRLVAMDLVNVSWHRYDLGWNVLGDYAAGGGSWGIGARTNSYQWHGMTPLAETPGANPGTGATRHHLHDHLGSTRALFDGGKARLARLDYEPHGQPTRALGATANRSFTGKKYDAAIGLYHFPYRHYSPSHARWMTRDPLGMVDGPNVYAYVGASPVRHTDPDGRLLITVGSVIFGSVYTACAAYAFFAANSIDAAGDSRDETSHCIAGCKLSKCLGGLGGGRLAYALNWYAEFASQLWDPATAKPFDSHWDNEAARLGADRCAKDCASCLDCCRDLAPANSNNDY